MQRRRARAPTTFQSTGASEQPYPLCPVRHTRGPCLGGLHATSKSVSLLAANGGAVRRQRLAGRPEARDRRWEAAVAKGDGWRGAGGRGRKYREPTACPPSSLCGLPTRAPTRPLRRGDRRAAEGDGERWRKLNTAAKGNKEVKQEHTTRRNGSNQCSAFLGMTT